MREPLHVSRLRSLELAENVAEDVTDCWAEQCQNNDHDDGYQYEDQSILYETLTFFTWKI